MLPATNIILLKVLPVTNKFYKKVLSVKSIYVSLQLKKYCYGSFICKT